MLLVSFASYAQEDNQSEEADTIKISFAPKGIRLGFDLFGATKTIIDSDKKELEFSADVEIHRYLVNLEYGQFDVQRLSHNNSMYQNKGTYFRTGIDINMLKKDADNNIMFFGFRYAKSTFDDQLQYQRTNAIYGDISFDRSNTNLSVRWLELTAGLKLHIANNFWLGFTNRFKFAQKVEESDILSPHDIPGYGKAAKNNYWGFNYQIMYKIPFRK